MDLLGVTCFDTYLTDMKIYTLNIIIDADGNIVHTQETIDDVKNKKKEKDDAIKSTTLEDMIIMREGEDAARA